MWSQGHTLTYPAHEKTWNRAFLSKFASLSPPKYHSRRFSAYRRAMASGAASTRGASQPATGASATGGSSQAPSGAPLVEDAQERRRALDGELYTMEEFRQFYETPYGTRLLGSWRRYWDQAVWEAVPPGAASCAGSGDCACKRTAVRFRW